MFGLFGIGVDPAGSGVGFGPGGVGPGSGSFFDGSSFFPGLSHCCPTPIPADVIPDSGTPTVVPVASLDVAFFAGFTFSTFHGSTKNPRLKHAASGSNDKYEETFPQTMRSTI